MDQQKQEDRVIMMAITAAVVALVLVLFGKSVQASPVIEEGERLSPPAIQSGNPKMGTVLLLHGLGRSAVSMKYLEKRLKESGYRVENINYPSMMLTIEEIAEQYLAPVVENVAARGEEVHFVTHSMGGIVVRQYLHHYGAEHVGRVVMLAPPNQGSEVVDNWKNVPGFKALNGPAGMQLGTDPSS